MVEDAPSPLHVVKACIAVFLCFSRLPYPLLLLSLQPLLMLELQASVYVCAPQMFLFN